jgi:hypothetical protein
MIGLQRALLPKNDEDVKFFLLVRITLKNQRKREDFDKKGVALLPKFEAATNLKLLVAGRDDTPDNFCMNLWQMRDQTPTGGGPNDLLNAMAVVHSIPEYGPVDDLVAVEAQDLMATFLNPVEAPKLDENPRRHYVLFEYDIDDGDAGTFAFNLSAELENVQDKTKWRCLLTSFPMTGDLRRYVQVFEMEADNEAAARKSAEDVVAKLPWEKPKKVRVLIPTAYDRTRTGGGEVGDAAQHLQAAE